MNIIEDKLKAKSISGISFNVWEKEYHEKTKDTKNTKNNQGVLERMKCLAILTL